MASDDPHVFELEKLAEKQMRSTLRARFLEQCRSEDVIPNGFKLKLQVSVGNDSKELQKSVDELLNRVSMEICERVRDFHLRKSHEFNRQLENKREELRKLKSTEELSRADTFIYRNVEEKKWTLQQKHDKKINTLKRQSKSFDEVEAGSLENDNESKQSTADSTSPWVQVRNKRKHNRENKRSTKAAQKSKVSVPDSTPKTSSVPVNHNGQQSRKTDTPTVSKNSAAPSTRMSYLEAAKNGALRQTAVTSLQETMTTLTRLVTDLITATKLNQGGDRGVSSDVRTKRPGGRPRNDYGKYKKGKRQC